MKAIFIDIETSGLNARKNGILQLAGEICIDGVSRHYFDLNMRPPEHITYDEGALALTGITLDGIDSYRPEFEVFREFIALLGIYVDPFDPKDKFHFIGYNANFDATFIRELFLRNHNNFFGSYFWYPIIDVAVLAGHFLRAKRSELVNFKLTTVAKYLDLKFDPKNLHNAAEDIRLTKLIYEKITAYSVDS